MKAQAERDRRIEETRRPPERFERIRKALLSQGVRLCTERALLITEFFKKFDSMATDPSIA